ncbi:sulfite exporter TauE/SafE family protein [Methylophaga pinxianii]|uniref:sulfite exporter TauE/SafE family protein n=1 Tax=Methylophaga pinxianii TaxID=2881052 RepID=UPI001CF3110B|nr:sulfite exporter TauE/SafE family protein [Methylophaga pinxianii]MCB2426835.1 sulfite exporter TauE/SafE family protein [Methylophaga pinxianii]UPH47051.1 sulfite exporter TauE/SafE family protein [Methylophaga pinxianii]
MWIEWFSYMAAGMVAGTLAGLFGIGGGLVIVPVLVWLFSKQALPVEYLIHMAVATSLMTIVVTSLSSIYAHWRLANISMLAVRRLVPGLVLGAFSGALLASVISGEKLQIFFALFALMMALRIWLPNSKAAYPVLLNRLPATTYGLLSGVISALVGIGGGTMIVPYLLMARLSIQQAIGSAACTGLPIAISGVIGFIVFAPDEISQQSDWQTGFVHWQAFFGIIATSIIFAQIGARIAKKIPSHWLRRMFSLLLIGVALFFFSR